MRVFLTGFMGAGKTTVGRLLAARLGCPFIDLDEGIERRAGVTVRQLFERDGEAAFRRLERAELEAIADQGEHLVVATGGGTVVSADNRQRLGALGVIVWLHPAFEVVAARLAAGGAATRPLFRDPAQARALYTSRLEAYRQCDLEVAITADDMAQGVAERIERWLEESRCVT